MVFNRDMTTTNRYQYDRKRWEFIKAFDGNMRPDGWHLIDNGEWCQTFTLLRDAKRAAEQIERAAR